MVIYTIILRNQVKKLGLTKNQLRKAWPCEFREAKNMAPRKKGAEREFTASFVFACAMDDIAANGLTIVPAKKPDSAINQRTVMTKDGPVVVYDTDLIDDDGTSAALWNLLALTGFNPENQG